MGVSDLVSHVLSFCSFSSRADKFSCVAKIVAGLFFAAAVIAQWSFHPQFGPNNNMMTGEREHLLTSIVVNGTRVPGLVPYPQVTICPLWPDGILNGVRCSDRERGSNSTHSLMLKPWVPPDPRFQKEHPKFSCMQFNQAPNSLQVTDDRIHVWCEVNTTNQGNVSRNEPASWPGRLLVTVQMPGEDAHHCADCYDGVNFGIFEANTTGFLFWGAHIFMEHSETVEYRVTKSSISKPLVWDTVEPSDVDFALGFYTRDVMAYDTPTRFIGGAAFTSERFSQFCTLIGGVAFFAYLIFLCLRGTLVLMFLGKESLNSSERTPII